MKIVLDLGYEDNVRFGLKIGGMGLHEDNVRFGLEIGEMGLHEDSFRVRLVGGTKLGSEIVSNNTCYCLQVRSGGGTGVSS